MHVAQNPSQTAKTHPSPSTPSSQQKFRIVIMVFSLPGDLYSTDPNFTTLFRLLDDFNSYSHEVQGDEAQQTGKGHGRHRRGPRPRFDIRETEKAYELYGEVPGADRKDIHIELTGQNTLTIHGHVDRGYDAPIPGKKPPAKKEGEGGEKSEQAEGDKGKEKDSDVVRFLQRERFVGDFEREFSFPGPLMEFDITASLENGILKVVAPKQEVSKSRKIEIQ
ncbi:HSP20-like chaperone [Cercophora newfieldiana]|uniref:HSP20-like chaperone n=1 Tax=Cercophora newfieldiana TaxID=92897 RepID=A0AA39YAW0_9PEZI|nr:HSP20-like chaperone [Cercophora newfieldiana]